MMFSATRAFREGKPAVARNGAGLTLESVRSVLAVCVLVVSLTAAACSNGSATTVTVVPDVTATASAPDGSPIPGNDVATPTVAPSPTPTPGVDGSIVVACGDPLVPLDKLHRLPADCAPDVVILSPAFSWGSNQLMTAPAAEALIEMLEVAAEDGYSMYAKSSYRSYQEQVVTFQFWVDQKGLEEAERQSARPGHSEHQLGTTTDLTTDGTGGVLEAFRGTPEAEWVAENSWKFGFIVSYPQGLEDVTGYVWEPWHVRFVGVDLAADVHASGLTLGEYLKQR
jgi:D-alanyl-D-alanine carboxypeptidase